MINFNKAVKSNFPYPHIVLDDVFTEDIFNKLSGSFNEIDLKYTSEADFRKNIDINDGKFPSSLLNSDIWSNVYTHLNKRETFTKFIEFFKNDKSLKDSVYNGTDIYEEKYGFVMNLARANDGYIQAKHVDLSPKFIVMLFFFQDKNWNGGDFIMHDRNDETKTKVFEAKKNQCIAFLSSKDSIHSVPLQSNTVKPRDFFYAAYITKDLSPAFKDIN